jgi:hypothetical protein
MIGAFRPLKCLRSTGTLRNHRGGTSEKTRRDCAEMSQFGKGQNWGFLSQFHNIHIYKV